MGYPGHQGPKGESGRNGEPGRTGIKGDKGAKGDVGIEGLQGMPGVEGPPGQKGEPGLPVVSDHILLFWIVTFLLNAAVKFKFDFYFIKSIYKAIAYRYGISVTTIFLWILDVFFLIYRINVNY